MEYGVVTLAALLVAGMALYSGFGLGTLLVPVFAMFFPVPVAVASAAIVHLANNVFRIGFVGRHANWRVALTFGLPAAVAAIGGALLLSRIAGIAPVAVYHLGDREFSVTAVKLVLAVLIGGFAALELSPAVSRWQIHPRFLPLGGVISGFFGGLSGHQGALRSAFLARAGLDAAAFVGTGSVAALLVDVSRLTVYGMGPLRESFTGASSSLGVVVAAITAAFLGTYLGSRFLKKVTMTAIRRLVAVLLVLLAAALASGLV
ncbi:MAG: sulfite exporter TauE/SafE family protein [Chloroflexi bacterium]|nr:sulfite exporter TauE/SafE family protein [Chloroflexota bacterium]